MGSFSAPLGSLGVEITGDAKDLLSAFDKIEAAAKDTDQKLSRLDFAAGMADKVSANVDQVRDKFKGLSSVGEQMSGIGTTLTMGLTAPLLAVGAASLKASGDFESAMNRVSAQGGIVGGDLDRLKKQAEALGAATQFSSREAAEGMAELASAGMNTEQIFAAMPGVMNLAAAAGSSVGQAAGIAKDLLGEFGIEATDTSRVVDVLAKAGTESSGTLTEMANSLKYVGPVAHSVGMTLEETSSALIVLDQAGIRGESAGTGLRSMLSSLLKPSKEAGEMIAKLGISTTDTSGKMLPFSAIIEQFRVKLAAIPSDAQRSASLITIFGEAGQTAANILSQKGAPALLDFQTKLQNSAGTAQMVAETMNKGLNGSLERLKGSVETAGQKLGEVLAPAVISLAGLVETAANKVAEFAGWFQTLPGWVQTSALAFVGLVAALGPALVIVGQLAQAFVAVNAAVPLVTGAMSAFSTVIGVGIGTAAIYTAGILAAAAAVIYLGKAVYDLARAHNDLDRANDQQQKSLKKLEDSLRSQGGAVDALKDKLKAGQITQLQYEQGLRGIALELGKTKKVAEDTTKPLSEHDKLQQQLKKSLEAAAKAAATNAASTEDLGKKSKKAADDQKPLIQQNEVLLAVQAKLQAEHKRLVAAAAEQFMRYSDLKGKTEELIQPGEELDGVMASLYANMSKIPPVIKEMFPQGFIKSITDTTAATTALIEKDKELEQAYRNLGITSTAEMNKTHDKAVDAYVRIVESGTASAKDIDAAWVAMEKARQAAAESAGQTIPAEQKKMLEKMEEQLGQSSTKQEGKWGEFTGSVSTIVTNFAQSIAKSLFDGDLSFGEKAKDMLKELGKAVSAYFIEPAVAAIHGFIAGAIKDLLSGKGLGGVMDSITNIGSGLSKIFGGGASAAGDVAGAAGGVAGAAGGAGSSAAGTAGAAAGAGIQGIVGVVSGVVSAVSGVISNFQFAAMNKSLDLIERYTRRSEIHLQYILEDGVNKWLPKLDQINGFLWEHFAGWFADQMSTTENMRDILQSFKFPIDWTMNFTDMNRQTLYEIRDTLYDIRGYLETTRDNTGMMKDKLTSGQTWTVQFTGDPIARLVGDEIMRQLRMQGINLV